MWSKPARSQSLLLNVLPISDTGCREAAGTALCHLFGA